jgi:hypothetical protein
MPSGTVLRAAFSTTPAGVEAWRTRLIESSGTTVGSPISAISPSTVGVAFICYFDGDFGRPRGNPPSTVPDASRMIVVILPDGTADMVALGFAGSLPILDPNR